MGATSLSGELGTKANSRRGQRAGMLSQSWLRFVLIMALSIAAGRRARQHARADKVIEERTRSVLTSAIGT